jgi:hypothetical protein
VAHLDPIRRLHVLAAAVPGTVTGTIIIHRPLEEVWAAVSDLEVSLPELVHDFRRVQVTHEDGDRLVVEARGYLGQRARFNAVMEPGWCWCQSRFLLCGLAAAAHPDGTLLGFLGGVRVPGAAVLSRLFDRPSRRLLERTLHRYATVLERRA